MRGIHWIFFYKVINFSLIFFIVSFPFNPFYLSLFHHVPSLEVCGQGEMKKKFLHASLSSTSWMIGARSVWHASDCLLFNCTIIIFPKNSKRLKLLGSDSILYIPSLLETNWYRPPNWVNYLFTLIKIVQNFYSFYTITSITKVLLCVGIFQ